MLAPKRNKKGERRKKQWKKRNLYDKIHAREKHNQNTNFPSKLHKVNAIFFECDANISAKKKRRRNVLVRLVKRRACVSQKSIVSFRLQQTLWCIVSRQTMIECVLLQIWIKYAQVMPKKHHTQAQLFNSSTVYEVLCTGCLCLCVSNASCENWKLDNPLCEHSAPGIERAIHRMRYANAHKYIYKL